MRYPRAFFALQLAFARKMAELSQQPYTETILHKTAFYRILGLDWSFEPGNPVWQAYLQGLRQNEADVDWTYQFYLAHLDDIPEYTTPRWGCFSYEYLAGQQIIHMHFSGIPDASGYGPLTSLRKGARLTELCSMFTHIKEKHPDARMVRGGSWLYNREEYTRLFPPAYGQSARAQRPALRTRGLWGQFLRYNGSVNERTAINFLERIAQLSNAEEYAQCFPYQVMSVEAPIELFYGFYGI